VRASVLTWDEYAVGWAAGHGGYDPRTGSPLARGWLRLAYTLGRLLGRTRIRPSAVTAAGLVAAIGVPLVAPGAPVAGAALVVVSALADAVDGALARIGGRGSRLGQVYDAVADRIAEACWLAALWRLGAPGWLPVAGWIVCWLHEYLRTRAAAAGMPRMGGVTVGDRPLRVIVVTFGLVVAGLFTPFGAELVAGTATAASTIFALLAAAGLGQQFLAVRKALR
jgi:CDP-diacylglycerol--glycerol-3-phosphate 3-phosphatidyltransferase